MAIQVGSRVYVPEKRRVRFDVPEAFGEVDATWAGRFGHKVCSVDFGHSEVCLAAEDLMELPTPKKEG